VPIIYPFESNPIRVLETTSFKQVCRIKANPAARIHWVDENQNVVSNPPTVHVQPKVTVNEGEALEIACRVDANPVASSIYWTYNKFPDQTNIRDQPNLHWFQSKRIDGSVLKIPYTYPYHSGQYYCHADAEIYMPQDLWLSQNLSTSSEVWSIWQQRSRSFAAVNLTINYSPGKPTLTVVYSTNNKGEDYIILRCQENYSVEIMSQLKLDHHGKPESTERPFRPILGFLSNPKAIKITIISTNTHFDIKTNYV
ncbi:unnamed protein product, partial [Schistosoma mattheei]